MTGLSTTHMARTDIMKNKLEIKTNYCNDQSPVVPKNLQFKGFMEQVKFSANWHFQSLRRQPME